MTCLCKTPPETNGEDSPVEYEAQTWSSTSLVELGGFGWGSAGLRQECLTLHIRDANY